ncbi:MAG: hypothetical protein AAF211_17915, partial [Myxococcota bacterium]
MRPTPGSRWSEHPVLVGLLTASLVWSPALLLGLRDPAAALSGVPELGGLVIVVLGLASAHPSLGRHALVRALAVMSCGGFGVFGVAWAASLVATDELLPLYDLMLLVPPVAVFAADLGGPAAPIGLVALCGVAGLALLGLAAVGFGHLSRLRTVPSRQAAAAVALLGAALGVAGNGFWTPTIAANLAESLALRRNIEERVVSRLDLVGRELVSTPDVRLYVIESYGDVLFEGAIAPTHRATLAGLEAPLREAGWAMASGRGISPTHGGRSWMADATLLTGIQVDRQATFDHVAARGRTVPSLPRFFGERGYATVLVRPKDRARPGVRL